jgi:hypothetical protein
MGRSLHIRYKEHIRKYNKEGSGFAANILRSTHRYGRIDDMENIYHARKGRIMNLKEKFTFIYIV